MSELKFRLAGIKLGFERIIEGILTILDGLILVLSLGYISTYFRRTFVSFLIKKYYRNTKELFDKEREINENNS